MDVVIQALATTPVLAIVLGAVWLLVMISVPIIRWVGGEGAERVGISLGVLMQFLLSVVVSSVLFGIPTTLVVVAFVIVGGWSVEFLGSRTGFPFGKYHYTPVLKPQLGGVPLLIPLAWFMMMPPSWITAVFIMQLLGIEWNIGVFAIFSGLLFTFWDFYLDPQMVRWNFWQWHKPKGYFGIPWSNYAGWLAVGVLLSLGCAFLLGALDPASGGTGTGMDGLVTSGGLSGLSAALAMVASGTKPAWALFGGAVLAAGMYALTAILQFIGQFFFWNQRGPALVGLLTMGAGVVLAMLGLLTLIKA